MLDDSPSRPTSSSEPGLVTTKLCGMMSLFSKTISTGLPAWAAIRSLLKSIWSVIVPSRITRTPRSPSSRRAFVARSSGQQARQRVAELDGVEGVRGGPVPRRDRLDVGEQRVERRACLVGRPVGDGNPRDRPDRGGPIGPFASHELREGLEGLGLLASDRGRARPSPSAGRLPPSPVPPTSVVAARLRAGRLSASKTTLRPVVEDLDGIVVEPLVIVAFGPVPDGDRVDRVTRRRGRPPTRGWGCFPGCGSGRRRRRLRSCCRRSLARRGRRRRCSSGWPCRAGRHFGRH